MFERLVLASVFGLLATACPATDPPPATAQAEPKTDPEVQKLLARHRAKRKAAEEAEATKQATLAGLAQLPEKLPKKIGPACEAVGDAQDAFMRRQFADDPEVLEKWKSAVGTQIPMTIAMCKKGQNIEVAACQTRALEAAPLGLGKDLSAILRACIEKYGPPPGGTVPPA